MTYTIEQLEALKEGTTPGPWEVKSSVIVWNPVPQDQASLIPEFLRLIEVILSTSSEGKATDLPNDAELAAASPALLDQLIATEAELQQLKTRIEALADWHDVKASKARVYPHPQEKERFIGKAEAHETARNKLTQILEGNE